MGKTRTNNKDWLLGYGNESSLAIGAKLTLKKAVMKRFLWIRQTQRNSNNSNREVFRTILCELKEIWQRAAIPVKPDKKCFDQLIEIHKSWLSVKKINVSARANDNSQRRIQEFNDSMNSLCDLSPSDIENQLKASRTNNWKEDLMFLAGQRHYPQTGTMHGLDRKEQERASSRQRRMNRRQSRSIAMDKIQSDTVDVSSESEQSIPDSDLTDDEYSTTRSTPMPSSVILQIPAKTLTKETGQIADSRNLSIRDQLVFQSALVRAGGGNINDMSMSLSTVHRQRRENRKTIAEKISEDWLKQIPPFVIVHWDSKLIKY